MRAHVSDVCDPLLLEEMVTSGFIKVQQHPSEPLRIFNYTQAAQFEGVWNAATLACRGLILDENGGVHARPFRKFFNIEQVSGQHLPAGEVKVTDKLDGSLGIIYQTRAGLAVATRGSFVSDQALHASDLLARRYSQVQFPAEWTVLVEIIYPENRIVVDYAGLDDLVLLGAVETASGRSVPLEDVAALWPGPVVEEFSYSSVEDVLAAAPRPNAEGMVLHFTEPDVRVKVKQADYVRLHRVVTDLSERRVWEALSQGNDQALAQLLEDVPDELFSFVSRSQERLRAEFAARHAELVGVFDEMRSQLGDAPRREYADWILRMREWPLHRGLFLLLDGKDVSGLLWREVRPREHVPVWGRQEVN